MLVSLSNRFFIREALSPNLRAAVLVAREVTLVDMFVMTLVLLSAFPLTAFLLMGTRCSVVLVDSRSVALVGRLGRLVNCAPSSSRLMRRWVFDHFDRVGFAFVLPVLFRSLAAWFRRC